MFLQLIISLDIAEVFFTAKVLNRFVVLYAVKFDQSVFIRKIEIIFESVYNVWYLILSNILDRVFEEYFL